jgi:hypothetical protein
MVLFVFTCVVGSFATWLWWLSRDRGPSRENAGLRRRYLALSPLPAREAVRALDEGMRSMRKRYPYQSVTQHLKRLVAGLRQAPVSGFTDRPEAPYLRNAVLSAGRAGPPPIRPHDPAQLRASL